MKDLECGRLREHHGRQQRQRNFRKTHFRVWRSPLVGKEAPQSLRGEQGQAFSLFFFFFFFFFLFSFFLKANFCSLDVRRIASAFIASDKERTSALEAMVALMDFWLDYEGASAKR